MTTLTIEQCKLRDESSESKGIPKSTINILFININVGNKIVYYIKGTFIKPNIKTCMYSSRTLHSSSQIERHSSM